MSALIYRKVKGARAVVQSLYSPSGKFRAHRLRLRRSGNALLHLFFLTHRKVSTTRSETALPGARAWRRRRCRLRAAAVLLGALVTLGGCAGDEPEKNRDKGQEKRPPARPLPAGWYDDPDGDAIPTHTELRIGTDPESDQCIKDLGCPGVDEKAIGGLREDKPSNTLLMLDSSGSMRGPAGGGKKKLTAAKESLERFVVGTPDSTELGLLVYGHKGSSAESDKAKSCRSAEVLAPLGEIDYRNAREVLGRFRARGYTPIARALGEAERTFAGKDGATNRIVLVSDGVETCGGDPVAAAERLKRAGIAVTVDVVGFDIGKSIDAARLKRIADVTGGSYTSARTGSELTDFVSAESRRIRAENRAVACIIRKGNALTACQIRTQNAAVADMIGEENRISADLIRRENALSSELIAEENSADTAEDRRRIDAARRQQTGEISTRRTRITNEISTIRMAMETRLEADRARYETEADRSRLRIEQEADQVERRLKERYGRP